MTTRNINVFMLRTVGMVMLFLMHNLVARSVGTDGYGVFSFALSVAAAAGMVAPLGWPTALIRFIAEYRRRSDWGLLHGAVAAARKSTLIGGTLLALILFVAALATGGERSLSLVYAALLVPFSAFVALRRKTLVAFQRPYQSVSLDEIFLPLTVIAAYFVVGVYNAKAALSAYLIGLILTTALSAVCIRRAFHAEIPGVDAVYQWKDWMRVAIPMAMAGISQMMVNRLDVVILGFLAEPSEIGAYAAAARFSSLLVFGLGAVAIVVPPILAAAHARADPSAFRAALGKGALFSGGFALLAGAPFLLWPEVLLGLFGEDFVHAAELLRILTFGQIISAVVGPVGFALLMSGGERRFATYQFVAAIAAIIADMFAFPIYGAVGVAIVTSTTVAGFNLVGLADVLWRTRTIHRH